MTKLQLIKSFWWRWKTKSRTYDLASGTTKFTGSAASQSAARRNELGAWRLELARRDPRGKDLPQIKDAGELLPFLEICGSPASINPNAGLPGFDVGFTSLPTKWNLNATDRELTMAFLEEINRMRRMQGIKRSQGPEGHRNRPVSWRYVEILDFKRYFPKEKLSPKDQLMWRRAKQYAEECFEHIHNLLEG